MKKLLIPFMSLVTCTTIIHAVPNYKIEDALKESSATTLPKTGPVSTWTTLEDQSVYSTGPIVESTQKDLFTDKKTPKKNADKTYRPKGTKAWDQNKTDKSKTATLDGRVINEKQLELNETQKAAIKELRKRLNNKVRAAIKKFKDENKSDNLTDDQEKQIKAMRTKNKEIIDKKIKGLRDGSLIAIASGTMVETKKGPRPAEYLIEKNNPATLVQPEIAMDMTARPAQENKTVIK